jgi:hypothetical protein
MRTNGSPPICAYTPKPHATRSAPSHRPVGEHALLAPFYVNGPSFPPVDGAPVLAVVKQTALDDGCGPALFQGVGNGSKNGLAGSFSRG